MYNPIIVEHFSNPKHSGDMAEFDTVLKIGNPVCGDTINIKVKYNQGTVQEAKFTAYGCATSLATADIFTGYIIGKNAEEILATSLVQREEMLGELEPSQMHCLTILHELFAQVEGVRV
jgi:nitrogen fixation protein NifU and related proteins